MTWSRFDDAARKHPKSLMAGNEAWGLWCAAIMYCNQYGTDGFIPDAALATEVLPCPITPAKAKKLARQLCEARLDPSKPGLFVRDDARKGYIVHDFLDWNPSKAELDEKRRRDRERKRGGGGSGGDSGSDSARNSVRNPRGESPEPQAESEGMVDGTDTGEPPDSASRARPRAGARPPAQPSQSQPAAGADAVDGSSLIGCPPDLDLLEAQKANLEMAGAKRWQVDVMVLEIRTKLLGSPERRTPDGWRSYLAGAVTRRWSDPSQRPKAEPEPTTPAVTETELQQSAAAFERHRKQIREKNRRLLEHGIPGLKNPEEVR